MLNIYAILQAQFYCTLAATIDCARIVSVLNYLSVHSVQTVGLKQKGNHCVGEQSVLA